MGRTEPATGRHGLSAFSSAQLNIALAQLPCADGDTTQNLAVACRTIAEASRQGADIVLFPEEYLTGFCAPPTIHKNALSRTGAELDKVRECARKHSVGVVVGFAEAASGSLFNTTVLLDKRGEPLVFYRKTHLWLQERNSCSAGDRQDEVVSFEGIRVGLLTCYDIEFPETARCLGLAGADCLLVTTGNMNPWQHRHRVFILARAIENHVFVAYCNRADSGAFYNHTGDSAVVDPFGRIVRDAGSSQSVITCTAHMSLIGGSKRDFDYFDDRRPELYARISADSAASETETS